MRYRRNIVVFFADQLRADALRCLGNAHVQTPNMDWIGGGTRLRQHLTPNQICQPSRAAFFTGLYPRHNSVHRNGTALPEGLLTLPRILAGAGYHTYAAGKLHFQPLMAEARFNMPESLAFWREPGLPTTQYLFDQYENGDQGARDAGSRGGLRAAAASWHGPYYGFEHVDFVLGESLDVVHGGHYAHWVEQNCPEIARLYGPEAALSPPQADLWEVWKSSVPWRQHYDIWIADRCCEFLAQSNTNQPFFAFVSFPDPHHPFSPPAPYCNHHDPADIPKPQNVPGELERMPAYLQQRSIKEQGALIRTAGLSDTTIAMAIAHTYGSIELIDHAVGRVLVELRRLELLQDTLVIFTADHGELLGDHGLLRKGPAPYRQLIEIPFMARGPGIALNRDVQSLSSHLDILPTLLAWIGMEAPESDGSSILPLLQGYSEAVHDAIFGEYHPVREASLYNRTITTDVWRLTQYADGNNSGELFDHRVDPGEHRNLFREPDCRAVIERLSRVLDDELPAMPVIGSTVYGEY